jgi:hypothetical protein
MDLKQSSRLVAICDGTAEGVTPAQFAAFANVCAEMRGETKPPPKPFKLNPPTQATPSQLVGDALTALLREYGLAAKSTCSCKSWAGKMNEWGVAGCREHRAEIVAHLAEAYHAATWWDTFKAAGSAVYHSLPLTLGGMVDEAIRRTENPLGN